MDIAGDRPRWTLGWPRSRFASRMPLVIAPEARLDLGGRQPACLATVKTGQLRQRVRAAAGDADVLCESPHRVPHRGVYPRPAQFDRRTRQVNRVQPATDPIAGLHHHAVNAAMGKSVRDRQSGDPRTDHHHTLDRLRRPHRNISSPVVETLSNQPGHPRPGEGPIPRRGGLRAAGRRPGSHAAAPGQHGQSSRQWPPSRGHRSAAGRWRARRRR